MNAIVPIPKVHLSIRVATMADLPFLDALQKRHSRALGYFPTKQFEGYIEMGAVLVAEEGENGNCRLGLRLRLGLGSGSGPGQDHHNHNPNRNHDRPLLGYIISRDRYLKRDELGVIFQLCVEPGAQRKLVGAALVQAAFDRSAYGCRLYCCWCAQDLEANHFWESLGFVPIAFRAGSRTRGGRKSEVVGRQGAQQPTTHHPRPARASRVHIFWQRRIREGDTTTPWWFPAKTESGAIREDRLVFPIPPGVHWKDVQAVVLPGKEKAMMENRPSRQFENPRSDIPSPAPAPAPAPRRQFVQFGPPPATPPAHVEQATVGFGGAPQKKRSRKRPAAEKVDAKLVSAARELRDRYLEQVNTPGAGAATAPLPQGKYHVAKQIAPAPAPATPAPAPATPAPAGTPKQLPRAA